MNVLSKIWKSRLALVVAAFVGGELLLLPLWFSGILCVNDRMIFHAPMAVLAVLLAGELLSRKDFSAWRKAAGGFLGLTFLVMEMPIVFALILSPFGRAEGLPWALQMLFVANYLLFVFYPGIGVGLVAGSYFFFRWKNIPESAKGIDVSRPTC